MHRTMTMAACLALAATGAEAAWSTAGDTLVGSDGLTLTSAWLGPGDPDSAGNLSGRAAVDVAVVEWRAGVAPYALDLVDEAATEGSVAWQTLAVAAGDRLQFDWAFSTAETDFLDHAFAVLGGQVFTLASRGSVPAAGHFEHTFASGGSLRLALGVVDTGDVLGVSTLRVSSLTVLPAVPEPGTALLLCLGAAAFLLRRHAGRRP